MEVLRIRAVPALAAATASGVHQATPAVAAQPAPVEVLAEQLARWAAMGEAAKEALRVPAAGGYLTAPEAKVAERRVRQEAAAGKTRGGPRGPGGGGPED